MKLIRDLIGLNLPPTSMTIGNFDAVHLGHQQLLSHLVSQAKTKQLASLLLTFEPLPPEFFSQTPPARLCSFREKWLNFKKWPLDYVVCLRFNAQLATLSAHDFVKKILVDSLHMKHLIVGEDFRFGHQRQGNLASLKKWGQLYSFTVEVIPTLFHEKNRISSTSIRHELEKGHLDKVAACLQRAYTLSGRVSYGHQHGRQLGFPTANIYLRRKKVPLQGVYAVKIHGIYPVPLHGVANIGNRPTLHLHSATLLEVHIFDFNQSLYGAHLTIEFVKKIREEQRFDSLDALKTQIKQDVSKTRDFFLIDLLT
ncbi:MAG: bifunctional riboflavin kinase/FAD synthetase [Gammaproteobacteria bacterium]|nr:bifunctional riboflavin kinase/FAD synthetase [Gammaproteobacteria bacterium]